MCATGHVGFFSAHLPRVTSSACDGCAVAGVGEGERAAQLASEQRQQIALALSALRARQQSWSRSERMAPCAAGAACERLAHDGAFERVRFRAAEGPGLSHREEARCARGLRDGVRERTGIIAMRDLEGRQGLRCEGVRAREQRFLVVGQLFRHGVRVRATLLERQ